MHVLKSEEWATAWGSCMCRRHMLKRLVVMVVAACPWDVSNCALLTCEGSGLSKGCVGSHLCAHFTGWAVSCRSTRMVAVGVWIKIVSPRCHAVSRQFSGAHVCVRLWFMGVQPGSRHPGVGLVLHGRSCTGWWVWVCFSYAAVPRFADQMSGRYVHT